MKIMKKKRIRRVRGLKMNDCVNLNVCSTKKGEKESDRFDESKFYPSTVCAIEEV